MKKIRLSILVLVIVAVLSACGQPPDMGKQAEDGNYHYRNNDLGFSISLPPEFIYYQTQRKETDKYTVIEFFVPTADTSYPQEIQSYAMPLEVRVFDKKNWQDSYAEDYDFVRKGKKRVYAILFWEKEPKDWQDKWNRDVEKNIIHNFSL